MADLILITGGAGFIGSHLADNLLAAGYRVRVLDSLAEQVHGPGARRPAHLAAEAELLIGDVRDSKALRRALKGVDAVIHLAALVGVGQSMYQVRDYVEVNELGTANLLQALIARPVSRLLVASSMSVYGEGLYRRRDGRLVETAERDPQRLRRGEWEMTDADGQILQPLPTAEGKIPTLASIYALSKYAQERQCLMIGQAYGIPCVALRFFNVYGPRQALSNPYTGVLAIFASRLLNGHPPVIFEDGGQRRDFVHVTDVAQACRLALESAEADGTVINIGSGADHSVRDVAGTLAGLLGRHDLQAQITARYRVGDIRHCFADIARAQRVLGYRPAVGLQSGLRELVGWLQEQIAIDRFDLAHRELACRGLTL